MNRIELKNCAKRRNHLGTTLVELLVVMVIFLIGILGVIQVFPAGFQALTATRNTTIATELARQEIERVKGRADQLPEMILPVRYVGGGPTVTIVVDSNRAIHDLGPAGSGIAQNGQVLDALNNQIGKWQLLSGSNVVRRVIGEGGPVPAPRRVGALTGGLLILQFAPIVFNASYTAFLRVYGNDMQRRYGQPGFGGAQPWQFFVSDEDDNGNAQDTLFLPIIPLPPTANESPYRISFSYLVDNGGSLRVEEVIDIDPAAIRAYLNPSLNFPLFWTIDIQALLTDNTYGPILQNGTYAGLDYDSVRVQRTYIQVASFSANPYEYMLLDADLGVLLFNPTGYNYFERRQGGQKVRLQARVNYDVLDWRILRQPFRVPDVTPYQMRLPLNSLMVKGTPNTDGSTYQGLEFPISNGAGGTQFVDVVLIDTESGGVFLHDPANPRDPNIPVTTSNDYMAVDPARSSYVVDKSLGVIRLLDADRTAPGLQLRLIYPGAATPTVMTANGRELLALYQARGEWSVQVLKAPSLYQVVYGTPGSAQCYVGGSYVPTGGDPTRIYFPGMDVGRKVTIGEIWYFNLAGRQILRDQDFVITASPADPLGFPYIDINTVDANATGFDFTNGYAVRTVKGASIAARVLWNPAFFRLGPTPAENMASFEQWGRNWRKTTVESYLERGAN